MKIKVGIIYGGDSVEHEVSIITAVQAMSYMDSEKYDIIPIYIGKDRTWYTGKMLMDMDVYKDFETLKKYAKKIVLTKINQKFVLQSTTGFFRKIVTELDIAFPIVHGKGVEDGSLAGYLDSVGIPYVGSNVLGSSLGQDKIIQKQIMEASNIPTPKYTWFYDSQYINDPEQIKKNVKKLGYPVIVKPAKLGSSIGIMIAKNENELDKAITDAIQYDNKILIEEVISDLMEVNCSVFGNYEYQETSALAQMKTKNTFLTFEDKYIGGGKGKKGTLKGAGKMSTGDMIVPAKLDTALEKQVKELSIETFKALNLSGVARIDLLIDTKKKQVYVNEPNTIPGCLAFYMWMPLGKSYTKLLDDMITLAIKDYKNNMKKTSSFESNVLSTFDGSKGLKGLKGKMRQ